MENMETLVRSKIADKIRKGSESAVMAMERLQSENAIAKDFVHEVGVKRRGEDTPNVQFTSNGRVYADMFGVGQFSIHKHAVGQFAQKLGIPGSYLTQLSTGSEQWQRDLAAKIMNDHIGWTERNRVLVRAVGDEVRGVLSDHYKRYNSSKIIEAHVEEVYGSEGVVVDGHMDDTKVFIETILPEPLRIETENNGTIFLAFGTRFSTSDYGDGALDLRSFVLQGVCLNGMVRESVLRKVHLGSRLPDNLMLSEETYMLDTRAYTSAVRDLTRNLYGNDIIRSKVMEVRAATDIEVNPERELTNLIRGRLLKGEGEEIGKVLMKNDPNDGVQGKATLWKVTQAITSYANREDVNPRRKRELQEIAGDMFGRITG